ncbi:MAG: hypothetical protein JNM56_30645, partial [Planctomycetia bacterium]|nr:hypothetical protein [Planctomycetia bacterium]
ARPTAAVVQGLEAPRGFAPFRRAVFGRDDRILAIGDAGGGITLYEIDWRIGPSQLRKVQRLDGPHSSMAFSPDGKTLAAGTPDGKVLLVDLATQATTTMLRTAHPGLVGELIYSADGMNLAGMVAQSGFTVWDARTRAVRSRIDFAEQPGAAHLAFTAQGELLAISRGYRVRCWDAVSGQERKLTFPTLPRVEQPGKPLARTGSVAALTRDGDMVIVCNDGTVYLWRRAANHVQHVFTLPTPLTEGLIFLASPRGDTVAWCAQESNRIAIWDVGLKRELAVVHRPFEGGITCRAYSSDGQRFFWSGLPEAPKPGVTAMPTVGGVIDLDVRRSEIARTLRP